MRDATVDGDAARELEALIEELSSGAADPFDWGRFDGFRYRAELAQTIFEATPWESDVVLGGEIVGDVRIDGPLSGDLVLRGDIQGSLLVAVPVTGMILLQRDAAVREHVKVAADVNGIYIGGRARVQGRLALHAAEVRELVVHGDVVIGSIELDEAVITEALWIDGRPSIAGDVEIMDSSSVGTIVVGDRATIGGLLVADSRVGDILVGDGVHSTGDVDLLSSSIEGDLDVAGRVDGVLRIGGHIGGRVMATGRFGGLDLSGGAVAGDVTLAPKADAGCTPVTSLVGARFSRSVHIGDRVSIVGCDFRQCGDLDKLDLVGADLFTLPDGSRAKELVKPDGASEGEMASIYRQLRVNLEGKGNRPASAFFYQGEMDSRRRAARQGGGWTGWTEWGWLSLYRLVAGYGLKVAPPLLWFAAAWAVATVVFLGRGLVVLHGSEYVSASWWQAASFTLQSMLSVFRPPDALLGLGTTMVQVALRILGPTLLGLAAFAVRDKVAR